MRFSRSISFKISLLVVCLVVLSIFMIALFSYIQTSKAIIDRTFGQLNSVKWEKSRRIENFFGERTNELKLFASSKPVAQLCELMESENLKTGENLKTSYENEAYFSNYLLLHPDILKLFIINNNNRLIETSAQQRVFSSASPSDQLKYISDTIFNSTFSQPVYYTDIIQDSANNPVLFVLLPLDVPGKQFLIGFEIKASAISDIMYENNPFNGMGKSGEAYLVGSDTLMRSQSRFVPNSVLKLKAKTDAVINALGCNDNTGIINDYRGIKVLSSYGIISINNIRWAIMAEIDYKEAIIPIDDYRNNMIFLGMLSALLFTAFIVFVTHTIIKPVVKLKNAALEIAKGNYDTVVENHSSDEVGQLTLAFNRMAKQLDEQRKNLEKERISRLSEMIDWQENERQRLSRELHDSLGQVLLSIKMRIQRAKGKTDNDNAIIEETNMLLAETVQEVRNISNDLMPSVLISYGLQGCLKNLCENILARADIEADFKTNIESLLPSKIQTYLYRIIQEAVNNIIKHSKATRVSIVLMNYDSGIELTVSDNGCGFGQDILSQNRGQGLRNITERVELLGGSCTIDSHNGQGTQIFVNIPHKPHE